MEKPGYSTDALKEAFTYIGLPMNTQNVKLAERILAKLQESDFQGVSDDPVKTGEAVLEAMKDLRGEDAVREIDDDKLAAAFDTITQRVSKSASNEKISDQGTMKELRALLDRKPFRKPEKDVGRNDACPCGSGKKFKKCCIHKRKK